MPQSFHVLRCASCRSFQVQQVKKSNKWICKLCGEKQSLLKVYGQGSGADCRCHVQKLNMMRGEMELAAERMAGCFEVPEEVTDDHVAQKENMCLQEEMNLSASRWAKYTEQRDEGLREEEDDHGGEGSVYTTNRQQCYSDRKHVTRAPRKRKQSWQSDSGRSAKKCPGNGSPWPISDRLEKTAGSWETWNNSTVGPGQLQWEVGCEQLRSPGKPPKPRQNLQDVLLSCEEPCMSTSKWGKLLCPSRYLEEQSEKMSLEKEARGASKPSAVDTAKPPLHDGLEISHEDGVTLSEGELDGNYLGRSTKGCISTLYNMSLNTEFPTTVHITSSSGLHHPQNRSPEPQTCPAPNVVMSVPPKLISETTRCSRGLGLPSPVQHLPLVVSATRGSLFQTDDDFDDDI